MPQLDLLGLEREMVRMTDTLSPSSRSSAKLASTANSKALQQASTSASSLLDTGGPLTAMATITSPSPLRITAPKLDAFKSSKMAASKFSLKPLLGGGLQ